ncbi:MAG TPA: hypothetical protein VI319_01835, partial [Burkholderiales bacterium]
MTFHSTSVIACASLALVCACAGPTRPAAPPDERTSFVMEQNWAKLDRPWGSTSAVDVDGAGHVWVFERCGANSCAGSSLDPVLKFDGGGRLVAHFGAGLMIAPHGIFVDHDGNVWVT